MFNTVGQISELIYEKMNVIGTVEATDVRTSMPLTLRVSDIK